MKIFITGTDTDIGKTFISSWLCLHTGYKYFKPIQTGNIDETDTETLKSLGVNTYNEKFSYKERLSPHLAARLEGEYIDFDSISLPSEENLIIEGAGGALVPINDKYLVIDLIQKFNVPVIVVARSGLGTINHTLLTLESLRSRDINILGVILNGPLNAENAKAIEFYGKVKVLAQIPKLESSTKEDLLNIPLTTNIRNILEKK